MGKTTKSATEVLDGNTQYVETKAIEDTAKGLAKKLSEYAKTGKKIVRAYENGDKAVGTASEIDKINKGLQNTKWLITI